VVSQAGGVLLVETIRKAGLDQAISAALTPWRKPRTVHDPGKVLLDVALAIALGGDCLADVATMSSPLEPADPWSRATSTAPSPASPRPPASAPSGSTMHATAPRPSSRLPESRRAS
jgi:hypothetical protein